MFSVWDCNGDFNLLASLDGALNLGIPFACGDAIGLVILDLFLIEDVDLYMS